MNSLFLCFFGNFRLFLVDTLSVVGCLRVIRRRELTSLAPTSTRRAKTPQRRVGLTPTLSKGEGEPARWARRLGALACRRDGTDFEASHQLLQKNFFLINLQLNARIPKQLFKILHLVFLHLDAFALQQLFHFCGRAEMMLAREQSDAVHYAMGRHFGPGMK